MEKQRIDVLLVEQGYFSSRTLAQRAIREKRVIVNDQIIEQKADLVDLDAQIKIEKDLVEYVSRGGYKLDKALRSFDVDANDKVCLDIGASTGGFSDCLLKHHASFIYAIDVGENQLAESLKDHPKIQLLEKTNFRYLDSKTLNQTIEIVVIDVSFIGLYYIFENLATFLPNTFDIIALIKPQFEARREQIHKNGLVKDPKVHQEIIQKVAKEASSFGFELQDLTFSPIQGEKSGNIEFLGYFKKNREKCNIDIKKIVLSAHAHFKKERDVHD